MTWSSFWHKVGGGISKAFGVVTSPIRWAGGIIKDTVNTVVHMPEKVIQGVTTVTKQAATVVNHVADDVKDLGSNLGKDAATALSSPVMLIAAGGAALLLLNRAR
jgi:phage-related protein